MSVVKKPQFLFDPGSLPLPGSLTFCYQIIKTIAAKSNWKSRLVKLLNASNSPAKNIYKVLGFSNEHWVEHPLWQ